MIVANQTKQTGYIRGLMVITINPLLHTVNIFAAVHAGIAKLPHRVYQQLHLPLIKSPICPGKIKSIPDPRSRLNSILL